MDPAELLMLFDGGPAGGGGGGAAGTGAAGTGAEVVEAGAGATPKPDRTPGESQKSKYFCSVLTIARGEQPYIREFVHYYRMLGFDHIFIYDNAEPEQVLLYDCLTEAEKKFCSVIRYPGRGVQREAYVDFIDNHSHLTDWALVVDVDEFLVLYRHPDIRAFIDHKCRRLFAVGINWYMFGFGGHVSWPQGKYVMESYTRGSSNPHIKTLARTEIMRRLRKQHRKLIDVHNIYDMCQKLNGQPIKGPHNPGKNDMETLALYHYWSKSEQEFEAKLARGRAPSGKKRKRDESYAHARELDQESNTHMIDVVLSRFERYLAEQGLAKEHIVELHNLPLPIDC
jgi:hypothetical protein